MVIKMGGLTDFEPSELWALAQLCKRIDGATLKKLSATMSEASDMLNGIIKLSELLAELGYEPRP